MDFDRSVVFFRISREFWDENKACEACKYLINDSSERRIAEDDLFHGILELSLQEPIQDAA